MKKLINKILKASPDPLGVRKSTAEVISHSQLVRINLDQLKKMGNSLF